MKLLHRTTRDFLITTTLILIFTGIGLYLLLKSEVKDEMEEQLALQATTIRTQVKEGHLPAGPLARAIPTNAPLTNRPVLGDTLIYDPLQGKEEDYHYRAVVENINGQRYEIVVMSAYVGWKKYSETIFLILLAALILFGISSALISYYSNRKIWRPFFSNLQQLKDYSVSSAHAVEFQGSSITEFKELQKTLEYVTEQSRREYTALREFTENASHEIQTPLGVILSKLDRLSQMEVNEEMAGYIVQAKSGVERLSKMNKNLLLLARLDNQAFDNKKDVDMRELISNHLTMMEELFASKDLHIHTQLEQLTVYADPYLCEVLVSNLFSNALRYTKKGGDVLIRLAQGELIISNDGGKLDFPALQLFDRFKKSIQHSTSTGLGLAIVQQICKLYSWNIIYEYKEKHVFRLSLG